MNAATRMRPGGAPRATARAPVRGRACMATLAALGMAALLAACAGLAPAPGNVVDSARVAAIVPGATSKAALLAALGPTQVQTFDSGFEVWNYRSVDAGQRVEVVILVGPDGVVRKLRQRKLAPDEPG
jgi:outer membrane protein assembly factor BamE (lipoprotein component of BamABCDE complex)